MINELEQRAYEPNVEISDTSARQPMSRGKKLGYVAAGVVGLGLVVGIGYKINKEIREWDDFGNLFSGISKTIYKY